MIEASDILFVYVETPLHAGSGPGLGSVDLPIQRERVSAYPIVQGSGLKGRLRADTRSRLTEREWVAVFGPERQATELAASAISFGDAHVILFPVRSLKGVFAWTTSAHALARLGRDASLARTSAPKWTVPTLQAGQALVAPDSALTIQDGGQAHVVLEEFSFTADQPSLAADIAGWFKAHALPDTPEYEYWRNNLAAHLCILAEDDFRDFVQFSTQIVTRVAIDDETKTVAPGALWTEESLPADTLLYAPVYASSPRSQDKAGLTSGQAVLNKLRELKLTRTRLGGNETVGRGNVYLRFWEA